MSSQFTEKHLAFHKSLALCSDIEAEIAALDEQRKALKDKLAQAEASRDVAASTAAEEKLVAGYIMIQMPDGNSCGIAKAKKRKGGAEPTNKFIVKYDERFDANMRRIQNNEAGEET